MCKSDMAGAHEVNSEFSFNIAVRGFDLCYHRVWLSHFGEHLRVEGEHKKAEDFFAIAVSREHRDTGAQADDDKPIVR